MRENFLTIPDAPDYEINSDLVVRNKTTGRVLKPIVKDGNAYYRLTLGGAKFRTAKTFRRQAVDAVGNSIFEPIPSTGGRYEINNAGIVRNALTKKKLKPRKNPSDFLTGITNIFTLPLTVCFGRFSDEFRQNRQKFLARRRTLTENISSRPWPPPQSSLHRKFFCHSARLKLIFTNAFQKFTTGR